MYNEASNELRVRRLSVSAFILLIGLLVADGSVGFRSVASIRALASRLVEDQDRETSRVGEVQRLQGAMSSIFYRLIGDPAAIDRSKALAEVDAVDKEIHELAHRAQSEGAGRQELLQLGVASSEFSNEARRLLASENRTRGASQELFRAYEAMLAVVSALVRSSHVSAIRANDEIERIGRRDVYEDVTLLFTCFALSLAFAVYVLRTTSRLYLAVRNQASELAQVSWRLLDDQEMIARRLSHELHDELGQSLTALKTTLTRHSSAGCSDPAWLAECSQLLKDSIGSVHEISQLLRPTILDDFGLESALRWLCERLGERTGIQITYSSTLCARVAREPETQLFRIAQEALTNVERHARASQVTVRLQQHSNTIELRIQDNGRGLPPPRHVPRGAFGIIGMQARARSANGDLEISGESGRGTFIRAWIPLEGNRDEAKDARPVG